MNNVRDFGAVGDGITKDTAAIQKAIDAGGIVHFSPGTYLAGTLYLKSNGGLELEPGATLLASPDPQDYNAADFCPQNWFSVNEIASGGHFIVCLEQHDVVIRGGGTIDGNHKAFLNELEPNGLWYKRTWRPSQMLYFCESQNIWIDDVNLRNSPYWTCFLHGCEFATISNVHIHGDVHVANQDGIDIDCCRFVTVTNCVIDSSDDCITLRGDDARLSAPKPCEMVAVSNCVLKSGYANALRIGVGSGVVRNCTFSNIVITETRTAVCVISKYGPKSIKGVTISDVSFSNLQLDVERFLNLKLDNNDNFEIKSPSSISRIHFSQIRGKATLTSYIHGNNVGTISDIGFSDINLAYGGCGPCPDRNAKGWWGRSSTDAAFEIKHSQSIDFDKVRVHWLTDNPAWTTDFDIVASQDIVVNDNCRPAKGIRRR